MVDQDARGAARWATLIAVPAALLAGLGAYALLGRAGGNGDADRPAPPAAQSTAPVEVPAPALDRRTAGICRALVSSLPDALRDRPRRPVTAGSGQNAAYGDPPIVVACGGPLPSFPPTDLVYKLNRVCWHAAGHDRTTVWTAVDRQLAVRVTVPRAYDGPSQWVIDFSAPVEAEVPAAPDPPSGCSDP